MTTFWSLSSVGHDGVCLLETSDLWELVSSCPEDEAEDQLVTVKTPPGKKFRVSSLQVDLDQALAYGIAEAGDRELILVLPGGTEEPTRRRLPWLEVNRLEPVWRV